jgi:DNA-binding CsgD family transcriptional regulator
VLSAWRLTADMSTVKIRETLPIVIGQTFLFVFIQKFLFGINAYEPIATLGVSLYEYYGIFLVALSIFILGYSFFAARKPRVLSKRAVMIAGTIAFPAGVCLLFDIPDMFTPIVSLLVMVVCLLVLCVSFCSVLFAWLNRMKQESLSIGVRNVLLSVLVAAFIYSAITPSDANHLPYMFVLEAISLPLAALCYLIPFGKTLPKYQHTQPANRRGIGYLVSASAFLFIMLVISYVDVLNEGYPTYHIEHPTFYALLLIAIAVFIAVLYKGDKGELIFNGATQGLIQILGAFFLLTYIFIFFYSSSSFEFCFQFTCFVRRLITVVFFVVVLSLTFIYDFKIEISIGIAFLVPYFLAKSLMMFFYLPVSTGALSNTSDFRLIVLLLLGILLILCVGFSWYLHKRNSGVSSLFEQSALPSTQTPADAARLLAVTVLSGECHLSEREKDILYFLSMGYSVNRIAELLSIANNTVGTHIRSVYKKMQLHNKQDVIDVVNKTMSTNPN